jgi:competence protein ComEA
MSFKTLLASVAALLITLAATSSTPAATTAPTAESGHTAKSARPDHAKPTLDAVPPAGSALGVVNVNDADVDTLQLIPGIGPSRADAIVAYRKQHTFKRIDDLTRIRGIGRKSLTAMRPFLTISGPSTLKEKPTAKSRRGQLPDVA